MLETKFINVHCAVLLSAPYSCRTATLFGTLSSLPRTFCAAFLQNLPVLHPESCWDFRTLQALHKTSCKNLTTGGAGTLVDLQLSHGQDSVFLPEHSMLLWHLWGGNPSQMSNICILHTRLDLNSLPYSSGKKSMVLHNCTGVCLHAPVQHETGKWKSSLEQERFRETGQCTVHWWFSSPAATSASTCDNTYNHKTGFASNKRLPVENHGIPWFCATAQAYASMRLYSTQRQVKILAGTGKVQRNRAMHCTLMILFTRCHECLCMWQCIQPQNRICFKQASSCGKSWYPMVLRNCTGVCLHALVQHATGKWKSENLHWNKVQRNGAMMAMHRKFSLPAATNASTCDNPFKQEIASSFSWPRITTWSFNSLKVSQSLLLHFLLKDRGIDSYHG